METFLNLLKLIPVIISVVLQVEAAIPGKGHGPKKLNLVLNTVQAAAQSTPDVQKTFSQGDLNKATTDIVNATVASLNEAGVFQK